MLKFLRNISKSHILKFPNIRFYSNFSSDSNIANKKWKETVKLLWKSQLPFEAANKKFQEILQENSSDLSYIGQYCIMMYERKQWIEVFKGYSMINKNFTNSWIPQIFDCIYQLENKRDSDPANKLLKKIKGTSILPIENRCLSILLSKMNKHEDALNKLIAYFDCINENDDLLALYDRMTLELVCKKYNDVIKSAKKLLECNPKNIGARYSKINALKELGRYEDAIIELTLLIGDTTDPVYKARLYLERAQCRGPQELEDRISDLSMSNQLCPENGTDKDILMLLFEAKKYEQVEEMMEKMSHRKKIEEDFDIAIIKGDLYRFIKKDSQKALDWYKKVVSLCPSPHYKEHFKRQIEIIEDEIKNEKNNNQQK